MVTQDQPKDDHEEVHSPKQPGAGVVDPELAPEAHSHFSRFPEAQFGPEFPLNPDIHPKGAVEKLKTVVARFEDGVTYDVKDDPISPLSPTTPPPNHAAPQQPVAQWSVQPLQPVVVGYEQLVDEELDRDPSGSSILEEGSIVGESGRTYHSYKSESSGYLLPNDPAEQDRLDLQHALMTFLWDGRLTLAPLPRAPRLALDVATGTGIWALEFARANPTSFVVGTDLSKIQPPPDVRNCFFERMDCEDDWLWSDKYDYVHVRMIVTAIRDPRRLVRQAYASLNPGGWLEMADADGDLLSDPDDADGPDPRVPGSMIKRWFDLCAVGAAMQGVDLHKVQSYKDWLVEAGFKEVREEKYKVPYTPWPEDRKAKRVGLWMQVNLLSGLRGIAYKMLRNAGLSPEEIDEFIVKAREEVKNGNIRGYMPLYAVYGRKPYSWETELDAAGPTSTDPEPTELNSAAPELMELDSKEARANGPDFNKARTN